MKTCFSRLIAITLIGISVLVSLTGVKANSGPPVNLVLTIEHDLNEYYMDLLIYKDSPLSESEIDQARSMLETDQDDYFGYFESYPERLITYQDSEGFVSYFLYENDRYGGYFLENYDENRFMLFLNGPREFKIAIYTENDTLITSEVITMSQFDYALTYNIKGIDSTTDQFNAGSVSGFVGHPATNPLTISNFFIRLLSTLGIEILILFVFGFRFKKTYYHVLGLNLITQASLTIGTLIAYYSSFNYQLLSAILIFILGEIFVFTVEMIYLGVFVKEHSLLRRLSFALIANLTSMVIGFIIFVLITNLNLI
ncbi:MAG: hypothetical protein ACLFRI_07720 [Candidatus Izemoplasmataceae bacterium]